MPKFTKNVRAEKSNNDLNNYKKYWVEKSSLNLSPQFQKTQNSLEYKDFNQNSVNNPNPNINITKMATQTLKVGVFCTIPRSNGRRQGATIMSIEDQQVQVEWEEDGECKAKQLSITSILNLNPHLNASHLNVNQMKTRSKVEKFQKTPNVKENKIKSSQSDNMINNRKPLSPRNSATPQVNKKSTRQTQISSVQSDVVSNNSKANTNFRKHRQKSTVGAARAANKKDADIKQVRSSSLGRDLASISSSSNPNIDDLKSDDVEKGKNIVKPTTKPKNDRFGFTRKSISRPSTSQTKTKKLKSTNKAGTIRPNSVLDNLPNTSTQSINEKLEIQDNTPKLSKSFQISSGIPTIEQPNNPIINRLKANQIKENSPNNTSRKSMVVNKVAQIEEDRQKLKAEHAKIRQDNKNRRKKFQHNPNWQFAEFIEDFRNETECNPLLNTDNLPMESRRITVCVRKRPINKKEIDKGEVDCVTVTLKDRIFVHEPKQKVDLTKYLENQEFRFDYIFDENAHNELVYRHTAAPLVQTVAQGGMATCFAYGQTGTGKTHTMGGEFKRGKLQNTSGGLYCFCARDLFEYIDNVDFGDDKMYVACSFFEIYSGRVYDLMNKRQYLKVMEDKQGQINVVNLREIQVENVDDVFEILQEGTKCRTSAKNAVNSVSSRSHAIFQLKIRREKYTNLEHKNSLFGQFSLVDLAGNERGSETANDRRVRAEGAEINKSLLALKECIRAMATSAKYLPFRGSQLTKVLRSSFVGKNTKTCMIAMISPCANSCEQTINTLRYADRVKELPLDGNEQVEECIDIISSLKDKNNGDNNQYSYDRESSSLDIISESRIDTSPDKSTMESMSGMELLMSTNRNKFEMSKEQIAAQRAADKVEGIEEDWFNQMDNLITLNQDLPTLLTEMGSVDINKDELQKNTGETLKNLSLLIQNLIECNNAYGNSLNEEEQTSKNLEIKEEQNQLLSKQKNSRTGNKLNKKK